MDSNSGLTVDPRYERTGFETNEYDLQDDSGAWDTMEYMRQFDREVRKSDRKREPLFAWTRPTIEWDLQCE